MASVSAPPSLPSPSLYTDQNPRNFTFKFLSSPPLKKPSSLLHLSSSNRVSDSVPCRCQNRSDSSSSSPEDFVHRRWDSKFQDIVKNVIKRFEDFVNSNRSSLENDVSVDLEEKEKEEEIEDWDWERWNKYFDEVEQQEKIVSVLKSQLGDAVNREDYEGAAKLKVAMAAAATNDIVGRVITHFNRAIEEERYQDAAFFRDYAGAGLVGWWAGISKDSDDPYGRIIRISVEHGRYVARNFSPRHLSSATPGVPLFEIFLTMGSKGEYKQKAVYLMRNGGRLGDSTNTSKLFDPSSSVSQLNASTEVKSERSATSTEDTEDRDDDSDVAEGLAGFQNILRDMIPGVKVTVLKVTAPEKVDKDLISKVIEQIMEEEEDDDEEKDVELESVDADDDDDVKTEILQDQDEIEMDAGVGDGDNSEGGSEMAVKVVIGGHLQKLSSNVHSKTLLRVPATLEIKGRSSFSFSIEEEEKQLGVDVKENSSQDKSATLQGRRSINHVMSDLAKFAINREKIPMKVLKDVEEFINLTLSQAKSRQPLSGMTNFNRIEIPTSSDILNGLYVGAHGLYTSEVIHLSRKFGQWQEDGVNQKRRPNLEFYEYVEALKLTGDPYVPAGQVAFRAKVGKQYQLPHKGIIPEEFGMVARYKGQGRLAEPGFKNPRWVDGELVILDGKYIKGGPVVGFVYWAPDHQFLVFFNRLRLPE